MSRRILWIAAAVLALAWLVPAGFVMLYDPVAAPTTQPLDAALGLGGPEFFLLRQGYKRTWTVETRADASGGAGGAGGTGDTSRATYSVVRGPLDARGGTFPFEVRVQTNEAADLGAVRLIVTDAGAGVDAAADLWQQVAEAPHPTPGSANATFVLRANVPAGSTAYQIVEAQTAPPHSGFRQSMLVAPTWLGRVYDQIAWRLPWRWLPTRR